MANYVKGKNIIVSMEVDSVYYPVFCAKTMDLQMEQELIEVTSVNSSSFREYEAGMKSYTMNMTGVTTLDNSNAKISVLYLMQQSATVQSYKITMTDDDGDIRIVTFDAVLNLAGFNRDTSGYSNSNMTVKPTGTVSVGDPIAPPTPPDCEVEDTLYLTLAEGATTVVDALLAQANVEIIDVTRSGATYYFTSGTPGSLQYAEDLGTGTISFDSANPGNAGGEPVTVVYKITA